MVWHGWDTNENNQVALFNIKDVTKLSYRGRVMPLEWNSIRVKKALMAMEIKAISGISLLVHWNQFLSSSTEDGESGKGLKKLANIFKNAHNNNYYFNVDSFFCQN